MKTIQQLRQEGYKVRVIHERIVNNNDHKGGPKIEPRGGKTIIELTTPVGDKSVFAVAECSKSDNFDRKMGNRIALRRAFQQLNAMTKYPPL
jgi:hypothetical protein